MHGKSNKYEFIVYLRVIGTCLVMWPHLTANINPTWKPLHIVQWLINRPLSLTQNFGALGVCLFFVISGFLAAESCDGPWKFLRRKIKRIYVPILFSSAGFFLFQKLVSTLFSYQSYWSQFSISEWVGSATLFSYFTGKPDYVNGVLWYLVPQWLFLGVVFLAKLLKRKKAVPLIWMATSWLLYAYVSVCGANGTPTQMMCNLPYIGIPIAGYLLNLYCKKEIEKHVLYRFLFFDYLTTVYGFYKFLPSLYEEEPYVLSAVIAFLLFCICLLKKESFAERSVMTYFSKISYSFYLTHSLYGGFLVSLIMPVFPYSLTLVVAVMGAILAAGINDSVVEKTLFLTDKGFFILKERLKEVICSYSYKG